MRCAVAAIISWPNEAVDSTGILLLVKNQEGGRRILTFP
jgi:hypothetical protein